MDIIVGKVNLKSKTHNVRSLHFIQLNNYTIIFRGVTAYPRFLVNSMLQPKIFEKSISILKTSQTAFVRHPAPLKPTYSLSKRRIRLNGSAHILTRVCVYACLFIHTYVGRSVSLLRTFFSIIENI